MADLRDGYYLHTNGSLIYRRGFDMRDMVDSDFVVEFWETKDLEESADVFSIFLAQARQLGAKDQEIESLAHKMSLETFLPSWRDIVFGVDKV